MLTAVRAALVLLTGGLLSSSAHAAAPPPAAVQALVRGNNAFAFRLYAQLATERGNLFISPFSVHDAGALAYSGARGLTATAMARAMRISAAPTAVGESYRTLLQDLRDTTGTPAGRKRSELHIANALFTGARWSLRPEYVAGVERDFGGAARSLDFAQREAASTAINGWVAAQTRDRIRDLVPAGALSAQTLSVLVNAIYFHGTWRSPFQKTRTQPRPFHRTPRDQVQVPMMAQVLDTPYAESADAQALSLPYDDGRLALVVLLPRTAEGLGTLERSLTATAFDGWLSRMKPREVSLLLPRFTLTRATRLEGALRALGMGVAFDRARADFSGMSAERPLAIAAVFHKAFVAVDEAGTEAAAATGIVMEVTSARPREEPVEFHADRPFVFLIRDERTGAILFMGRVADPS